MRECTREGCTRKHDARGLCKVHYNKAVRAGTLQKYDKVGRPPLDKPSGVDYIKWKHQRHGDLVRERAIEDRGGIPIDLSDRVLTKGERAERKKYLIQLGKDLRGPSKVKDPRYVLWANAKSRAKVQGVPCDIAMEDIIIPDVCPLLDTPLKKGVGRPTDNSPTLDKIIPELGYVKGNIQVLSYRANLLKSNASFEEYERIYKNWKRSLSSPP